MRRALRTRMAALAVGTALVTGAGLSVAPAPAAPPSSPGGLSARTTSEWRSTRAEFGFATDAAHLAAVSKDPQTTSRDIGVPLTAREAAEMARRQGLGGAIGRISALGARSAAFGGVRMDQAGGGVVEIQLTAAARRDGTAAKLSRQLLSQVPAGNPVRVVTVPYADRQLTAAVATITGRMRSLQRFGVRSVTRQGETVQIGIVAGAPSNAEASLTKLFPGRFIRVVRSDQALQTQGRNFLSGPLWGGEWMSSTAAACTVGYSRMKYGSRYYSATAGHCGGPNVVWKQGNSYSGNTFGHGGGYNGVVGSWSRGTTQRCDCQVVGPIPDSASTTAVLIDNNAHYAYTYTPDNTAAYYYNGKAVCTSGAHYGDDHGNRIVCGSITDVNASAYYSNNDVTVIRLVTTTVTTTESGDSGGPVGSGRAFMGLHNGLLGGHQYFSRSVYLQGTTTAYPTY